MLEYTHFQTNIFFQLALPSGRTNFTFPWRLYEFLFSPYAHHSLVILSLFLKYSHIYSGIRQFHVFDVYCPSDIHMFEFNFILLIFIFLVTCRVVFNTLDINTLTGTYVQNIFLSCKFVFLQMLLFRLRKFPSIPIYLRIFIINGCWVFSNVFSSVDMIIFFLTCWCGGLHWLSFEYWTSFV